MLMDYIEEGKYIHIRNEDKELFKEIVIEENIPLGRWGRSNPDSFFISGTRCNFIIYDYETHGLLWSYNPRKDFYEFKDLLSEIKMTKININIDEFI